MTWLICQPEAQQRPVLQRNDLAIHLFRWGGGDRTWLLLVRGWRGPLIHVSCKMSNGLKLWQGHGFTQPNLQTTIERNLLRWYYNGGQWWLTVLNRGSWPMRNAFDPQLAKLCHGSETWVVYVPTKPAALSDPFLHRGRNLVAQGTSSMGWAGAPCLGNKSDK